MARDEEIRLQRELREAKHAVVEQPPGVRREHVEHAISVMRAGSRDAS